ncbi:MAG: glycosyltransferase [Chitinivibrionales bacterium]|nr:glycosyltransferase [Chitinivibrionales bacterium]
MTFLFARRRKERLAQQRQVITHFDAVTDEQAYPKVVTQLPMYNEHGVAARVIEAAAAIDYPRSRHEIQVLDDSTDETRELVDQTVERLRGEGVRVSVIRRADRTGFKAGALQEGLRHTDAELIAIFDADFVPPPDFLRKAVAFFVQRRELGLVQGRWTHLNRSASMLTRGQAIGIDGHFVIEQAARTWNNLFMNFNGTAGVFRREAIESSGGWQHDTLTEDLDLSYRMQLNGWKTEYVPDLVVPAEIPEDVNGFKNQQFRWAKGSIQTARKVLPRLFAAGVHPFRLLQALLHLTYYVVHPFVLTVALLTAPVLSIVNKCEMPLLLLPVLLGMGLSTFGPSIMYMTAQHTLGNRGTTKFLLIPIMMFIGVGLAVNNTWAVAEALIGRVSPFHRTPKKGQARSTNYRPIKDATCIVELAVGVYCMLAFRHFFMTASLLVTPFLLIYSAGFLFIGLLSIIHYHRPDTIDWRVPRPRFARAAA